MDLYADVDDKYDELCSEDKNAWNKRIKAMDFTIAECL